MGKKLIIKGADFSENGMLETVITLDKSALFTSQNVEVTSENVESLTKEDTAYYYIRTLQDNRLLVTSGTNHGTKLFNASIDVEGYDTVEISLNFLFTSNLSIGFTAPVIFTGAALDDIKKAYTNVSTQISEDIVEPLGDSVINRVFSIPVGAKYLFITDRLSTIQELDTHKVTLKKYNIE